jgi:hypothetical protein
MIKKDLAPDYENLCSTFCEDSIGRNEDLLYFIKLLDSISGPYSIAIDGRWGSGKTFFVKQAKMLLDVYNPHSQLTDWNVEEHRDKVKKVWDGLTTKHNKVQWDPKLQLCVYFDAWEYDSEQDPMTALLYQIAKAASTDYKIDSARNNLDLICNIIALHKGYNPKELLQSLRATNITDEVKDNFDLRSKIDAYFSELLPEHGDRLIIFIDELDRCVPAYAVRLLERIKHYFINDKVTFVFSLNMEQMQHTIRQHYGDGFDAHKYIERFFDLTIPMPKINRTRFNRNLEYDTTLPIFEIAEAFSEKNHMEMREITRYYAALHMMTSATPSSLSPSKSLWFCYHFLLPIALGLQKCDISKYYQFVNGEDSSPLIDLLSNETVLDYASSFFSGVQENELIATIERVYNAIFVGARNKKSDTICGSYYNERTLDYFFKTVGMLNSTTVLD